MAFRYGALLRYALPHEGLSHWLMIAFITCNSNLVPLLEGLCISNPCRFEFSVFWIFAGIEPTTSHIWRHAYHLTFEAQTDVTVSCGPRSYKLHKAILARESTFFRYFFNTNMHNNANNATHYVKLGKKSQESCKHSYYSISPIVIIKAIIIIIHTYVCTLKLKILHERRASRLGKQGL